MEVIKWNIIKKNWKVMTKYLSDCADEALIFIWCDIFETWSFNFIWCVHLKHEALELPGHSDGDETIDNCNEGSNLSQRSSNAYSYSWFS